jgi:tetratricopeptide (TPR) repeat protein
MSKRLGLVLACLALVQLSLPAAAAEAVTGYSQCTALVQKNPALAEENARAWRDQGGGAAADHCSALALTALKRYAEAARKFDALARDKAVRNNIDRAELLDQAGNAWMLAGNANDAVQSFSAAIGQSPNNIDFLADRARARAMQKDWAGAETDLGAALFRDQNRADLLVLRASARWALNRKADAATDILRALDLFPDYPAALVERGRMKYEAGDEKGARADWKKAASGTGEAAEAARRNLSALGAEPKPVSAK